MPFDPDAGMHLPEPAADAEQVRRRQHVLRDLGLTAQADPEFDTIAAALATEAGAPYAMVNLFHAEQTFIGLFTADDVPNVKRTMRPDHGWCPDVVERANALVLPDVMSYPRFAGNPVVDRIGIRSYAGAPLIHTAHGQQTVLGTVCFVDRVQRPNETGRPALELIKRFRDEAMQAIQRRTRRADER
ncbi:GAF domain-containing protein [Streptomyces nanshensis]|uniref:GAF domain-containing protein n=1 Tax=Streptomyces nanshensis TaxID=518642 RepID=A0A1E7LA28_9ACTN|nr:GAF domain-containing protein [Streptomyces nanshensis]OEV13008.1 hypothetical protein AN218_05730 [Streptomyces nanshensis]